MFLFVRCVYNILIFLFSLSLLYSIEGVVEKWGINETFVGLILLPIVGK
jgi:Ca2+:H+ antiporter